MSSEPTTPVASARYEWIAFLAGAMLLALALSWLASIVQAQQAPIVLFPLIVGGLLGLGLLLLARFWPGLSRTSILVAALAGGLVLFAGQHGFAYRQYRGNYEQSRLKNPQLQLLRQAFDELRPMSFGEFLRFSARERNFGPWQLHGWAVWLSWAFDGLLTLAAAVGLVCFNTRSSVGAA